MWPPRAYLGAPGWLCLGFSNWRRHGRIAGGMVVVMSKQAEALRLADALETEKIGASLLDASAAELRRLHELAQEQHTKIYGLRLEVRNLLEALKLCEGNISSLLASAHPRVYGEWLTVVSAAIAKSTGETK
jgi:hypothetical protein